jgi:hypothetical protein
MAFHFRQIKPRRRPLRDNRLRIMKYIKPAKPAFEMYKLKVVTSLDLAVRYNICFSFGFRISVNKPDISIAGINF